MMLIDMIPMGILNFALLIVSPFVKIPCFLPGWLVGFISTSDGPVPVRELIGCRKPGLVTEIIIQLRNKNWASAPW
jgi:hypothetical protein